MPPGVEVAEAGEGVDPFAGLVFGNGRGAGGN